MRGISLGIAAANGAAALFLLALSGHRDEESGTCKPEAPRPAAVAACDEPAADPSSIDEFPERPRDPAPNPDRQAAQQVIDEIRNIRGRLGLNPLAGTSLEAAGTSLEAAGGRQPGESEFLETLRDVVPVGEAAPIGDAPPNGNTIPSVEPALVSTVRDAARQLADRADEHEQQRDYDRADRLRRLANRLRREARNELRISDFGLRIGRRR